MKMYYFYPKPNTTVLIRTLCVPPTFPPNIAILTPLHINYKDNTITHS